MAESIESLFRRGQISGRQLKRRFQTGRDGAGVPTKMADFDDPTKDEGSVHQRGEIPGNEIEHPTNQARKRFGRVSRGGDVNASGNPKANQINQADYQRPSFPARGSRLEPGEARRRVGVAQSNTGSNQSSGPLYGGPNSRRYG
jgi:hypothetical protein